MSEGGTVIALPLLTKYMTQTLYRHISRVVSIAFDHSQYYFLTFVHLPTSTTLSLALCLSEASPLTFDSRNTEAHSTSSKLGTFPAAVVTCLSTSFWKLTGAELRFILYVCIRVYIHTVNSTYSLCSNC